MVHKDIFGYLNSQAAENLIVKRSIESIFEEIESYKL